MSPSQNQKRNRSNHAPYLSPTEPSPRPYSPEDLLLHLTHSTSPDTVVETTETYDASSYESDEGYYNATQTETSQSDDDEEVDMLDSSLTETDPATKALSNELTGVRSKITQIETRIATLENCMFAVREREINKEYEAIEAGHHPKFEAVNTALLAQRDKRLLLANAWLRYGKERAKNLQEGMWQLKHLKLSMIQDRKDKIQKLKAEYNVLLKNPTRYAPKNLKYPKMGTFPRMGVFDNNSRVIESRSKTSRTLPAPVRSRLVNKSWIINAWLGSDSDSGEVMDGAKGPIMSGRMPVERPVVNHCPRSFTMDEYLRRRYSD
ncbi:5880_t:CDS:2 [Paraglomus brasilianum]|uniref:5880_t:CDS:1 n=1 Tax=Paraglomus brasilianum TaxID=144538 RepID=A0A9N8W6P6_9GLOM|nr:5880_t:CDS:2 [Paraglomus brasilianum]